MIDSGFLQNAVLDVAKSFAGISIARAIDLPGKLDFGQSFVGKKTSEGALTFLTSDAIDGLLSNGEQSKLYNKNLIGALDDTLFYSAIGAGMDVSNADVTLMSTIMNTFNLPSNQAELIAQSCIMSGSRVVARYVDHVPEVPQWVKNVRYPIRTLTMGM